MEQNEIKSLTSDYVLRGDKDAYTKLFLFHYDYFLFMCSFYYDDIMDSEDLIQTVYIKLFNKNLSHKDVKTFNFKNYFMRALANQFVDYTRRGNKFKKVLLPEHFEIIDTSKEPVSYDLLNDCIKELSMAQNKVVRRRMENKSFKEIAHELNISVNTARGQYRYAVLHMRKRRIELEEMYL